jgi:hypothetical protein
VDVEVNRLHIKRIAIGDLVGYVYIVRVDIFRCPSYPHVFSVPMTQFSSNVTMSSNHSCTSYICFFCHFACFRFGRTQEPLIFLQS